MIKYIMRNIELPSELITHIYSFIDDKTKIKKLPEIWFKRIISPDYQYYSSKMKRMCLAVEERMLNILIKQGAFAKARGSICVAGGGTRGTIVVAGGAIGFGGFARLVQIGVKVFNRTHTS